METQIRRKTAWQRRLVRPFAIFVMLMTMIGMLPGGITDAAAQNTQDSETVGGQEAGATTYLEIHLAQCPADFDGQGGGDYYNSCHSTPIENIEVQLTATSGDPADIPTQTSQQVSEDGPGVVRFEDLPVGEYQFQVNYAESAENSYYTYCSVADGDDEVPVEPNNDRSGTLTIPDDQAVVCDWYLTAAGGESETETSTVNLTGYTCETGLFEPGSDPSFDDLSNQCTNPAAGTNFTQQDPESDQGVTVSLDDSGTTTLTFDPARGADIFAEVRLADDEWMYCASGTDAGEPSQVTLNEEGVWEIGPANAETLTCTWFFSDLPDATAAPTEEPTEEPTVAPTEADAETPVDSAADGPGSITIYTRDCGQDSDVPVSGAEPPEQPPYADLQAACTESFSYAVTLTYPDGTTSVLDGEDGDPHVWENLELGFFKVSTDLPGHDTNQFLFCWDENGNPLEGLEPNDGVLNVDLQGRNVVCEWYVQHENHRGDDATVEPSANENEGTTEPAPEVGGEEGPTASISVLPTTCPQDFDPATGTDYDTLKASCQEPLADVGFNLTAPNGAVDTKISDGSNPLIWDGLTGTHTLYSEIPLEAASEYAFCRQDGGNLYQREFNDVGVTTFENLQAENIVCEWFVVPEDLRGEETGASLEIHYAQCPAGYTGDAIFDDCHSNGVAGKNITLTAESGDPVTSSTVVEREDGPGIARFTDLAPGNYTIAVEDEDGNKITAFCNTQPEDEAVNIAIDGNSGKLAIGENEHVLCDWYVIPGAGNTTPTPTPTTERAEIIVTLYACPAADSGYAGATLGDFQAACDEKVNDVEFKLGDVGAPTITSTTGKYADGALRFWDLLPGNFLLTPELPDNLNSASVFCSIDGGDQYQKALSNGATRFEDLNGESITCEWYTVEESVNEPTQPSGSVTIRQRLCEGEKITNYDEQCAAGASGTSFTLTSSDGSITKDGTPNAQGVYVFSNLPDGFYNIKQNEGTWCKAVADRVDSRSRVIVEGGTNTDVVFYQCGDVTRLPTTGTGPAGTVEGDDLPLISASMWAVILGLLSIPFAMLAVMQTVRARRQVQEVETPPAPGPIVLSNGRMRMRYR